jgi:hypothetical protein
MRHPVRCHLTRYHNLLIYPTGAQQRSARVYTMFEKAQKSFYVSIFRYKMQRSPILDVHGVRICAMLAGHQKIMFQVASGKR